MPVYQNYVWEAVAETARERGQTRDRIALPDPDFPLPPPRVPVMSYCERLHNVGHIATTNEQGMPECMYCRTPLEA